MKREEMILKLHSIDICVVNITYTQDIGIMFDILSSRGISSDNGCNYSQWPCLKFVISEGTRSLIAKINMGKEVSDDEICRNTIFRELCSLYGYNEYPVTGNKTLETCIAQIREGLKHIDYKESYLYAYVMLYNWSVEVRFFSNYKEMESYFKEVCGDLECESWDEMSDEELDEWYKVAEDNDWEGIPYIEMNEN